MSDHESNQEAIFSNEVPFTEYIDGTSPLYKYDKDAPVAIRRIHPNSTKDSQAYSLMNEDPRTIFGLSAYSTTNEIDEEVKQTEVGETETMAPVMQLAFIGDAGVPEKYRGEILGMMGIFHFSNETYAEMNFPKDALVLTLVCQKKAFTWREDLNTAKLLGDTPADLPDKQTAQELALKRVPIPRKDIEFAREIGSDSNLNDKELSGVMKSGVQQGMRLVVDMESRFAEATEHAVRADPPKGPRKIIFVASARRGNTASKKGLQDLNFIDSHKSVEEDGDMYDLYYKEASQ